jgi:hypothetical protein
MSEEDRRPERTALNRILGSSPSSAVLRLLFASGIVGCILMWADRPHGIWARDSDPIHEVAVYLVAGIEMVVMWWLVLRLLNIRSEWVERKRQGRQEEQEHQRGVRERQQKRQQEWRDHRHEAASGNMSAAQALELLDLDVGATKQQILTAHKRLMKLVHPDTGGSTYLSKQLNVARDILLKQREA